MKINEAILTFKVGKASIVAEFKGGNLFNANRPARCTIVNPLAQYAIENDPRFGSSIKLESVYDDDGNIIPLDEAPTINCYKDKPTGDISVVGVSNCKITATKEAVVKSKATKEAVVKSKAEDISIVENITDINGVVEKLKELGCKSENLTNIDDISSKCIEHKLSFPNVDVLKISK
ncbi:MAG: hypothetical protein RR313_01800 [Anaerovoracaceae bacterium]